MFKVLIIGVIGFIGSVFVCVLIVCGDMVCVFVCLSSSFDCLVGMDVEVIVGDVI